MMDCFGSQQRLGQSARSVVPFGLIVFVHVAVTSMKCLVVWFVQSLAVFVNVLVVVDVLVDAYVFVFVVAQVVQMIAFDMGQPQVLAPKLHIDAVRSQSKQVEAIDAGHHAHLFKNNNNPNQFKKQTNKNLKQQATNKIVSQNDLS